MLETILGVVLLFTAIDQSAIKEDKPKGYIFYQHPTKQGMVEERGVIVKPVSEFKYDNVVRQAYDYSCGSAALTTVLNFYLGRTLSERQVMEGLLHYGESERIVERRAFSMLDMKRLVTALGYPSGGFRATIDDLKDLDHPAIVPIHHAGFKHFVVLRTIRDGRAYQAVPSEGNISFPLALFEAKWDDYVLFIVIPGTGKPLDNLQLEEAELLLGEYQTMTL